MKRIRKKRELSRRARRSRMTTLIIAVILLIGVGIMAYPTVSDKYNRWLTRNVINSYESTVQSLDEDQYKAIKDAAASYNKKIAQNGIQGIMTDADMEEYFNQLKIGESTAMGFIEIPKINQRLTIYHTTGEKVLETGVGHMEGTSLPVGGECSHCALSGHRGLPSAKLFTDLDKMEAGDIFQITVLDDTFTYEVDQILVTDPDDLAPLAIEEGQDLCTLITCTPYAVNTHRLLVRGHRIANPVEAKGDADPVKSELVAPFLMVGIIGVILVIALARAGRRRYKKKHGKRKKRYRIRQRAEHDDREK